ncbi:CBS domain-containing protein [candidate division GN15 bacterium]|nr:CBS domain-containing protein [candidate division GN15 bacterium]
MKSDTTSRTSWRYCTKWKPWRQRTKGNQTMFGRGVRLFSIFGFEVKLDWSWLILAVLISWTLAAGYFPLSYPDLSTATYVLMGIGGALGLFLSVVFHELAHSLVARQYGIPMRGITLFIFGGVAQMTEEAKDPKSELLMAVAGPIASVLIGGLFFTIASLEMFAVWPESLTAVLSYLALINILLAVFNMIPAFPLDGGRVLRAGLWAWKDNLEWATRITSQIGSGFGVVLIGLGVVSFAFGNMVNGVWLVLLGLFLRHIAQNSYKNMMMRQTLAGESVRRFTRNEVRPVAPDQSVQEFVDNFVLKYYQPVFPVVDGSKLVGCVSVDQVKHISEDDWERTSVSDIATECGAENTVEADAEATKILTQMTGGGHHLMVVENGRFVGMLSMRDMVNYLMIQTELKQAG